MYYEDFNASHFPRPVTLPLVEIVHLLRLANFVDHSGYYVIVNDKMFHTTLPIPLPQIIDSRCLPSLWSPAAGVPLNIIFFVVRDTALFDSK